MSLPTPNASGATFSKFHGTALLEDWQGSLVM